MYIAKDNRMFYALLIAIAIQSVGVYALIHLGIIEFSAGTFPWLLLLLGLLFLELVLCLLAVVLLEHGIVPEKVLLGSWIALFGYMTMSAIMKSGALVPLYNSSQSAQLSNNSIAETTGISVWVFHC